MSKVDRFAQFDTDLVIRRLMGENHFRHVALTGKKMQLVFMTLMPGEEIGREVHKNVSQLFIVIKGFLRADIGRSGDGDDSAWLGDDRDNVLFIDAGTEHNITNVGNKTAKLLTVYSPPNHIDGRIHATKREAEEDTEDEEFGKGVK